MTTSQRRWLQVSLLLGSLAVLVQPPAGSARSPEASSTSLQTPTRDGQHDFDFEFGTWKAHLSRRLHPLTGSTTWTQYEGTSVLHKVWNGRANLGEIEFDGPRGHIEGLSLRLYNPSSHQWSISFSNSNDGTLGPAMIGEFRNGRGEFFDQELFNGRSIYVRFIFSNITSRSFRLEQAFSGDGGRSWEANWIATFTRVQERAGLR